ncbi:MAG: sulfotransferase [Nevskia sp.]
MSSIVRSRIASASSAAGFLSTYFREAPLRGAAQALLRLCDRLGACAVSIWVNCTQQLLERDAVQGLRLLDAALASHPDAPALLRLKAAACRRSGDPSAAEQALRRAAALAPDEQDLVFELAALLRDEARMDAAAEVVNGFMQRPRGVKTALAASEFLVSCGHHDHAYAVGAAELGRGDRSTALELDAGMQALALGRFDEAGRHLRAALHRRPPEWGATLPLALSRRYRSPLDPDITAFSRIWEDESIPDELRLPSGFALGKAFDDLGLVREAAGVLRAANRLADLEQLWSPQNWRDFVEAQLGQRIVPLAQPVRDDLVPVFVIGLPRTGTTLIADRLGRHPDVRNRGELNWIAYLSEQLAIERRFEDAGALRRAAEIYLRHLRRDDAPARFYIDKNPLNFRHLGLISALFPNARIIHGVRSERDTALSIWSQLFDHADNAYAYRFDHILELMRGHDRLIQALAPGLRQPMLRLRYETLVGDPAGTLAQVGTFVGLDGAADLLAMPARPGCPIGTASVWQARQPISERSVGRAAAYLPVLPELSRFSP